MMSKYEQIYTEISKSIDNKQLKEGCKIPSETELMKQYEASRGTVRKAVDLLQERGYVQKFMEKVFCFKAKNIEFNFGGIVSFQEENERLGRHCITEVVEMDKEKATKEIAKLLNVKRKTEIDHIKRVRNIDGEKVILDINHFVSEFVPGLTKEIATASIYKYIEKELGLHISYSQRVIEVQPCTEDDRKYLDLNGTDYVVVVKNFTFV